MNDRRAADRELVHGAEYQHGTGSGVFGSGVEVSEAGGDDQQEHAGRGGQESGDSKSSAKSFDGGAGDSVSVATDHKIDVGLVISRMVWHDRLRYIRMKSDLSREDVGRIIGVCAGTIGRAEQGKTVQNRAIIDAWMDIQGHALAERFK